MQIDFHAHILPGADHGSRNVETSLKQLQLARAAGIDRIIATPHFYPAHDTAEAFLARRERTFARLQEADEQHAREVLKGAEVHLCAGLHHMKDLDQFCVEGTSVLLLELPMDFSIDPYVTTLDGLLYERKLTVVLAHIDRYATQHIEFLLDSGFLGQLNAASFCHIRTKKRSLQWAERPEVVAFGSDIHGTEIGYSEFLKAKQRLGTGFDQIMKRTEHLLETNKI